MRNKGFVIAVLLTALAAGTVSAEEVIHFTNGTVMPIRSHKIEGDLIKVDLGDNGFMAFPKSVVEKIEEAPGVMLMPSTAGNKMFASDPSTRVYGAAPRQSSSQWALPTQMDKDKGNSTIRNDSGVISAAPYANSANPALRNLRVNSVPEMRGASQMRQEEARVGAPQKIASPSVTTKKVLTTLKAKD